MRYLRPTASRRRDRLTTLLGIARDMDQVPEERLQVGEQTPANHSHDGVELTDDSLREHLAADHMTVAPEGLSFGALQGIHDRFHGEAHAADD
jgi:hypothetical protein